jgi:DNA-binding transcriptional MerR regulator
VNSFTISQLQDYSGIKAHTIRVWEKRYKALTPSRSEGNTRSYDGHQLRRLLNIVSLMQFYKVSKLCALQDKDLNNLLEKHFQQPSDEDETTLFVSQIISTAFDFDEAKFEKLFANSILRIGLKETYIHVLYPALKRLGLLWTKDSLAPAHEHFIVNLIRQKILVTVDALPPPDTAKDSWLLFLPEDEFHETGLLIAFFLIRHSGRKVYYIGSNVPIASLANTIKTIKPNKVLSFMVGKKDKSESLVQFAELSNQFRKMEMHIACHNQADLPKDSKLNLLHSVNDLEVLLS